MKRATVVLLAAIVGGFRRPARLRPDRAGARSGLRHPPARVRAQRRRRRPLQFDFLARSASGAAGLSSRGATIALPGFAPALAHARRGRSHRATGAEAAPGQGQSPHRRRSRGLADRHPDVRARALPGRVAGHRRRVARQPAPARVRLRDRSRCRSGADRRARRPSAPPGLTVRVPGRRRRAPRRCRHVRGRGPHPALPARELRPHAPAGDRPGRARVLDLPRRQRVRDRATTSPSTRAARYITGRTSSTNFNTVGGVEGNEAGTDAFVSKLNPAGNALVYSTYLGGNGPDEAHAIAIDALGFAYVDRHHRLDRLQHRQPDRGRPGRRRRVRLQAQPGRQHARVLDLPGRQQQRSGRLRDRGRLDAGGVHRRLDGLDGLQHQPADPDRLGRHRRLRRQAHGARQRARVLDLPRRRRRRLRRERRRRSDRVRVRDRDDRLDGLHDRQPDRGRPGRRRRVHRQVEPARDGVRVLDLPGRRRRGRRPRDRRRPDRPGVHHRPDRLDRLQHHHRPDRRATCPAPTGTSRG